MICIEKAFDNIKNRKPMWVIFRNVNYVFCEECDGEGHFVVSSPHTGHSLDVDCPACDGEGQRGVKKGRPISLIFNGIFYIPDMYRLSTLSEKDYHIYDVFETEEECQAEIDREKIGNE